jgi:hypothetical protein
MTMKVGPETSARASTSFVRPKDMRKKSWSPGFPYSLYMAFTVYIYDEKFGAETSPTVSTLPVRPIYMTKKVGI